MGYVKKIWVFLLVLSLSLALTAPSFAGKWFGLLPQDDQAVSFSFYETEESSEDLKMSNTLSISDWPEGSPVPRRIPLTMTLLKRGGGLVEAVNNEDKSGFEEVFQHASEAIYQMTQGRHVLGDVRIFLRGQNLSNSDILWTRTTEVTVQPGDFYCADVHGINNKNYHIYMVDVAQSIPSKCVNGEVEKPNLEEQERLPKNFLFPEGNYKQLGYTLAHELGHYMYGLWDEYQLTCQNHVPVVESVMGYGILIALQDWADDPWKYLNFSLPNDPELSCDWENWEDWDNWKWRDWEYRVIPEPEPAELCYWMNTERTKHHQLMNESCWETLLRKPYGKTKAAIVSPGDWYPTIGQKIKREYFPELASAMPEDRPAYMPFFPPEEVQPNVIWMTGDNIFQIVIDRSGSMSTTMMNNAKQAAKLLVDRAEIGESMIGVISFAGDVQVDYPLTRIDNEETKNDIKTAIDRIRASGSTAIYDAASKALRDMLDLNRPDAVKSVFLLTDGRNNAGTIRNPDVIISSYREAQVPLFTFSYGLNADFATLYRMSFLTGGETFRTPTTYAEISRAFESAFRSVAQSQGIGLGAANVKVGETEVNEFYVDSTIGNLTVSVRVSEMPADASVTLFSPSSSILEPYSEGYQEVSWYLYKIDDPEEGVWSLEVSADASRDVFFDYEVSGTHKSTPITLDVSTTQDSNEFVYPEPVFITATLSQDFPITGANVEAMITYPDGSLFMQPMQDVLGYGTYGALLPYTENGNYYIDVIAYDFEGRTMLNFDRLQCAPALDGPVALPDPRPFGVHFQRTGSINVKIEGVQDDDHGNSTWEATTIFADNEGVEGRIDYEGDVDVFSFIAPEGESELAARLFPIGEWDVVYRLLDSDGTTQLAGGTANQLKLSVNGYYYVEFNVEEGWEYYLSVEADQGSAMGVHYAVSVGTPAPFDIPLAGLVTFQTLLDNIMDGFDSGLISPYGVAQALMATVQAAQESYELGEYQDSWDQLGAFVYQLEALGHRRIDDQLSQKLISDAEYLRGTF